MSAGQTFELKQKKKHNISFREQHVFQISHGVWKPTTNQTQNIP